MSIRKSHLAFAGAAAALVFTTANAATSYDGNGQVPSQFVLSGKAADRLHDHISINLATAEKLAAACEAIAKKNNSQVVVVVLDPQGLPVLLRRMDGEGHVQITATQQKALTALRTRAPSRVLNNRNVMDPFTNSNMAGYGLTTQEGGLPIIVNGQLIGAIGVGGIPPVERNATYGEEMCARDALEQVIGPQPPLLPDLAAQQRNAPAGGGGPGRAGGRGAPVQ
jgi:glc operon protein GlcG